MITKTCNRCQVEKVITDFNLDPTHKDGHKGICRACTSAYKKTLTRKKHPPSQLPKRCRDCGVTKEAKEFHKDYTCQDGRKNSCMICQRAKGRLYSRTHTYVKRKRYHTLMKDSAFRAKRAKKARDRYQRIKHKKAANNKVRSAIRKGILKPLPCHICGHPVTEAHHPDYSKPYDVIWLCAQHHGEQHRLYP